MKAKGDVGILILLLYTMMSFAVQFLKTELLFYRCCPKSLIGEWTKSLYAHWENKLLHFLLFENLLSESDSMSEFLWARDRLIYVDR